MDNLEILIKEVTEIMRQFVRDFLVPYHLPFQQRYEIEEGQENKTAQNKLHRFLAQAIKPEVYSSFFNFFRHQPKVSPGGNDDMRCGRK